FYGFTKQQQVRVRFLPSPRCFFDEPVHVQVDGLSPHQKVKLRSILWDDKGVIFRASSVYKADATGQVDLCRSPSLGGSYTGVEPMGLFWAMAPETPHNKANFSLHRYARKQQKPIPPPPPSLGQGPFPGVLDVYILGGGLSEVRASLNVPKHFDLEYFEEAITFLRRQPQVSGGRRRPPQNICVYSAVSLSSLLQRPPQNISVYSGVSPPCYSHHHRTSVCIVLSPPCCNDHHRTSVCIALSLSPPCYR
uniref:Acyl-CoA thioester hydrolase/bile acid-CoA amino acid N-acetyltransferase domain-containing protein n=1 Tax=Oncorhynchus mykiss TaxID=8022 RepID=A0A8C7NH46_ONCMY